MTKPNTTSLRAHDEGELHSDSNIAMRIAALRVGIIQTECLLAKLALHVGRSSFVAAVPCRIQNRSKSNCEEKRKCGFYELERLAANDPRHCWTTIDSSTVRGLLANLITHSFLLELRRTGQDFSQWRTPGIRHFDASYRRSRRQTRENCLCWPQLHGPCRRNGSRTSRRTDSLPEGPGTLIGPTTTY